MGYCPSLPASPSRKNHHLGVMNHNLTMSKHHLTIISITSPLITLDNLKSKHHSPPERITSSNVPAPCAGCHHYAATRRKESATCEKQRETAQPGEAERRWAISCLVCEASANFSGRILRPCWMQCWHSRLAHFVTSKRIVQRFGCLPTEF